MHLLDVCSMIARYLLDHVNGVLCTQNWGRWAKNNAENNTVVTTKSYKWRSMFRPGVRMCCIRRRWRHEWRGRAGSAWRHDTRWQHSSPTSALYQRCQTPGSVAHRFASESCLPIPVRHTQTSPSSTRLHNHRPKNAFLKIIFKKHQTRIKRGRSKNLL